MKKFILTILLGMFGMMALAAPALAATSVSFTPVNVSARQGQTFTLTVGVNPHSSTIYSAKIGLRYPADLLEVRSFNFGNSWMHVPPDDVTDNTGGILRRTAGYPNPGLSSQAAFGTVSFLAKASGTGAVSITAESVVYDGSLQNVLTGVPVQASVVITAQTTPSTQIQTSPPAPNQAPTTPVVQTQPNTIQPEQTTDITGSETVVETPIEQIQADAQPLVSSRPLAAQVAGFLTLGTGKTIIGISTVLIILTVIGFALYALIKRIRRKKNNKNI